MERETSPALPVLHISPYLSASSAPASRSSCAKALFSACSKFGFFYLIGHGISTSTTAQILDLARRFLLEASNVDKARIARKNPGEGNGDGARGYQRIGENVTHGKRDWHEAIDFCAERDDDDDTSSPPYELLGGKNQWPDHSPELKTAYQTYIQEVKKVGTAVVHAMGAALDLGPDSDIFVRNTRHGFWVTRMVGYPGLPSSASPSASSGSDAGSEAFSCGEHTDYGCVTLLLADWCAAGADEGRALDQCGSGAWRVCGEYWGYDGEVNEWALEEHEPSGYPSGREL